MPLTQTTPVNKRLPIFGNDSALAAHLGLTETSERLAVQQHLPSAFISDSLIDAIVQTQRLDVTAFKAVITMGLAEIAQAAAAAVASSNEAAMAAQISAENAEESRKATDAPCMIYVKENVKDYDNCAKCKTGRLKPTGKSLKAYLPYEGLQVVADTCSTLRKAKTFLHRMFICQACSELPCHLNRCVLMGQQSTCLWCSHTVHSYDSSSAFCGTCSKKETQEKSTLQTWLDVAHGKLSALKPVALFEKATSKQKRFDAILKYEKIRGTQFSLLLALEIITTTDIKEESFEDKEAWMQQHTPSDTLSRSVLLAVYFGEGKEGHREQQKQMMILVRMWILAIVFMTPDLPPGHLTLITINAPASVTKQGHCLSSAHHLPWNASPYDVSHQFRFECLPGESELLKKWGGVAAAPTKYTDVIPQPGIISAVANNRMNPVVRTNPPKAKKPKVKK